MRPAIWLCLLAACGNDLPPPGSCDIGAASQVPEVRLVALPGSGAFDDLRYSPELKRVVAAPHGTGFVSLIEPDSLDIASFAVPAGVESADASATTIYVADRPNHRIVALDVTTGDTLATGSVPGTPDYVRFSPATGEVWVSIPATNRIEILDAATLAAIGSVTLPAPPEGLTFDGDRAYSNANGRVTAIDVAHRLVVGEWRTGCGYSHGFPQVDDPFQLAFGGCFANGGVGVVTMHGELRAGFEAGGGEAILAYEPKLHHLYVRGDGSSELYMFAACRDGELGQLAKVTLSPDGHGASADDRGHVWVADADTGGVYRVTDPFPGAP